MAPETFPSELLIYAVTGLRHFQTICICEKSMTAFEVYMGFSIAITMSVISWKVANI